MYESNGDGIIGEHLLPCFRPALPVSFQRVLSVPIPRPRWGDGSRAQAAVLERDRGEGPTWRQARVVTGWDFPRRRAAVHVALSFARAEGQRPVDAVDA